MGLVGVQTKTSLALKKMLGAALLWATGKTMKYDPGSPVLGQRLNAYQMSKHYTARQYFSVKLSWGQSDLVFSAGALNIGMEWPSFK